MTTTGTINEQIHEQLVAGLVRARRAADEHNLDPDEVVTWMTTSMMALIRSVFTDWQIGEFHGHQLRFLKGPDTIGFSAHPKLV